MTIRAAIATKRAVPFSVPDAAYAHLDGIGLHICGIWHLVPPHALATDSLTEVASFVAQLALCSFDQAMSRVDTLSSLGIIRWDGTVDPAVLARLQRAGATLMGMADLPAPTPDSPPPDED